MAWNTSEIIGGALLTCLLILSLSTVNCEVAKDGSASGEWDPFDDSFYDSFDELDKTERVYNRLDAGFANWEERCLRVGGQRALDAWLAAQEDLIFCVMKHFDKGAIKAEVEAKKETGDLDLVFRKYCDKPVKRTRPCVEDFLDVSRGCLKEHERGGLNVTLKMIDAAVDFICYNNGDRLALFMFEDGLACMENRSESIMDCINKTVPEFAQSNGHNNLHLMIFTNQNCRKVDRVRHCIESELLQCPDPTPSNVISSMLLAMEQATPCGDGDNGLMSRLSVAAASTASLTLMLATATAFVVLALPTT